jgi:FixJ family two-component response regulator
VLEDDDDLRELLGQLLEELGSAAPVLAKGVASLVTSGAAALATQVAILDINLGPHQPNGLDAYVWLRERGYAGRIVFLTGHAAAHPLVERAGQLDDARVLAKPVTVEVLSLLIREHAP